MLLLVILSPEWQAAGSGFAFLFRRVIRMVRSIIQSSELLGVLDWLSRDRINLLSRRMTVALALWEFAGQPNATALKGLLPSALTHEELAAVVGASRPRVSIVLKELENKGFFVRDNNQIRVQTKRLRDYLQRKYKFLL